MIKKLVISIFIFFSLLFLLDLALEPLLLRYVNKVLNRLPEYYGKVNDLDIDLIKGAYTIEGFSLTKKNSKIKQPFLNIAKTELSVEWKALFARKLVGEVFFSEPVLNIINSDSKKNAQTSTEGDWQDMVEDLFPIKINRAEINKGKLTYRHEGTNDPISLEVNKIDASVENLSNSTNSVLEATSPFLITANVQNYSQLTVRGQLNPLSKNPIFNLNLTLAKTPLTRLNTLLRKSLEVDAEGGTIELYGEASSKDKRFNGYLKPILKNVNIVSLSKDSDNPLRLAWESVFSLITEIFTNQRHSQFATKIEFEGTLKDPNPSIWLSLLSIIENAYIEALKSKID
jgi:Domain of Unknown Function (DUF748)